MALFVNVEFAPTRKKSIELCLSSGIGRTPEFYEELLQDVWISIGGELLSFQGKSGGYLDNLNHNLNVDGVRLMVFRTVGNNAKCATLLGGDLVSLPIGAIDIDINPKGSRVIRLLFDNDHFTRLLAIEDLGGDECNNIRAHSVPLRSSCREATLIYHFREI